MIVCAVDESAGAAEAINVASAPYSGICFKQADLLLLCKFRMPGHELLYPRRL
jgi:hypothetical protein